MLHPLVDVFLYFAVQGPRPSWQHREVYWRRHRMQDWRGDVWQLVLGRYSPRCRSSENRLPQRGFVGITIPADRCGRCLEYCLGMYGYQDVLSTSTEMSQTGWMALKHKRICSRTGDKIKRKGKRQDASSATKCNTSRRISANLKTCRLTPDGNNSKCHPSGD